MNRRIDAQGPGRALFSFVRHWSRKTPVSGPEVFERGRLVLVTDAVQVLTTRGAPATVNAIAREIGIDQSGTSRLLKEATERGYLDMRRATTDGRRREATVTYSGRTVLHEAYAWQEEVFARLTEDWSESRREDFQRAMNDLVERSHALQL